MDILDNQNIQIPERINIQKKDKLCKGYFSQD